MPALVAEDAVAGFEVLDVAADLDDFPAEFVAEDLGLLGERNEPASGVAVVVGVALKKVKIRAAHADGPDASQHVTRANGRVRNAAHRKFPNLFEQKRFHVPSTAAPKAKEAAPVAYRSGLKGVAS